MIVINTAHPYASSVILISYSSTVHMLGIVEAYIVAQKYLPNTLMASWQYCLSRELSPECLWSSKKNHF